MGGSFPTNEQFWGAILADLSSASEWLGRDVYPREIAYAPRAAETPHLVLSTTLTDTSWLTARIVHDINEIRALKQQPGKPSTSSADQHCSAASSASACSMNCA